jgi:hypothetical protein
MNHFTDQQPINPEYHFSKDLHQFLTGKRLLPDELPFPNYLIQHHHQNGYLHFTMVLKTSPAIAAAIRIRSCSQAFIVHVARTSARIAESAFRWGE